jgi:ABC-type Zn uptake system ZnuABC Zn-binding protein ZnuA
VGALFVVPAATVRLVTWRLVPWQLGSVALAAAEGIAGLWVSVETNTPPGAAVAVVGGGVFALAATGRVLESVVRRRHPVGAVGVGAVLVALTGCGSGTIGTPGAPIVVATTTQIGDWARLVGGTDVDVHQILQPNTDPHEYEPRPKDVEATADSAIVLENGDNLDKWMGKVVDQAGGSPTVVDLGDHVPVRRAGESSGPEASRYDPHWWHDPRNAEAAVREIRDVFVRADPSHRAAFERRAAAYLAKLETLDRGIAACFAAIPPSERKLVTDHDAFGYFAARYGITVVGAVIPSQTTQAQPSAGETAKLIQLIRREHVKAVFPESSVNARLAETVAHETGASSGYRLYGDTLGPADSRGATYLSMERANADAMTRGFTGGADKCSIRALR